MRKLKRFFLVVVLFCLVLAPSFSDVVLTDEEAVVVFQALIDSENFTERWLTQSDLWLVELGTFSQRQGEFDEEVKQLEKSWKLQLKEANRDKIKVALSTGGSALVVGIIIGILIDAFVD